MLFVEPTPYQAHMHYRRTLLCTGLTKKYKQLSDFLHIAQSASMYGVAASTGEHLDEIFIQTNHLSLCVAPCP